ncbi:MAG: ribosome-associated translation inhibitor RaiA [Bryobacterales bacterium]|jgi:putative sigma-54 modulation protein|nr:ribosome-associated translation inhibitor RaiA [Bryobacterales bacterium]
MKIAYSGKLNGLTKLETEKLEGRLKKLARFVDMKKGERQAHVSLRVEKRSCLVDVSVLYKGEVLATSGEAGELFAAATMATDKLERQLAKSREKRQDTRKRAAARNDVRGTTVVSPEVVAPSFQALESVGADEPGPKVTIHRVNHLARRKPMSVDEAVSAIKKTAPYLVFRDADSDSVGILIRRKDGDFDLIETPSR